MDTLKQQIRENLKELNSAMQQIHHKVAQQNNITLEQFDILIELDELWIDFLDENMAPTVGQIAENIGNPPTT